MLVDKLLETDAIGNRGVKEVIPKQWSLLFLGLNILAYPWYPLKEYVGI